MSFVLAYTSCPGAPTRPCSNWAAPIAPISPVCRILLSPIFFSLSLELRFRSLHFIRLILAKHKAPRTTSCCSPTLAASGGLRRQVLGLVLDETPAHHTLEFTVASRLESLGAITQGDRRAASLGSTMGDFNVENKCEEQEEEEEKKERKKNRK